MTQNLKYQSGASSVNSVYGGYYTWNNAQNVCPSSWNLPNDNNYNSIITNYDSTTIHQSPINFDYPGQQCGSGYGAGSNGAWWTSQTSGPNGHAFYIRSSSMFIGQDAFSWCFSVRCISSS